MSLSSYTSTRGIEFDPLRAKITSEEGEMIIPLTDRSLLIGEHLHDGDEVI